MKRIGIIGAGSFGGALVESLSEKGSEVLLMDIEPARVDAFADYVTQAVRGDAANIKSLVDAGFDKCDTVVVCMGSNLEASIMATANCKELGISNVISKAISDTHGRILKRIGADLVVYPNRDRAQRLARALLDKRSYSTDFLEVADGVCIAEIDPPDEIVGKTLVEAGVRQRFGITILVIRRMQSDPHLPRQTVIPDGGEKVLANDKLVVFAEDIKLQALANL